MNNTMKRKKLIINALILTLTTVTLGFINTSFRVYLSNKIGAEGMGLYQLIMSIHIMTSTLAISGIRVTTTRLIAEELGRGNKSNIKNIMRKAFIYSLFFSLLTAFVLYQGSEFIAINWIEDKRAILPLKILSCSLPFVGVGACFHGYFYGMRKVIKSISTDIIEVSTLMIVISTFLSAFLSKGLGYTCALISVGITLALMASTIVCYILYLFEKKSGCTNSYRDKKNTYSLLTVSKIAFPIACSAYIQTGLKTVEDILIPDALRRFGSSTSVSLSTFGMIKGMVLPILYFPSIFLASFSTLIIPEISEAKALNQTKRVNNIIAKVFKFTLLIAIFASGLFIIYSKELGIHIYNNIEVGFMMRVLAPLIPFMYLDRVVDGSLNALDQQMSTLRYNLIDMGVRIVLILFLIPKYGVTGFIIVLFAGTLLNSMLSINRLLKVTNLDFLIGDWILKPAFCVTLASYMVKLTFDCLHITTMIIPQILLVVAIYLILLIMIRCIKKTDIMWFFDAFKNDIKTEKISDLGISKRF
ncbi:MAG: polysaccharide biosynthesis C-terminal domain-containing protein [Romboutsia sp.]|uniref:oligosaccharide flippase family protein n=1 Tax=Romboutsia sp. TaxID=1965302 RepID=UPI003F33015E